MINNTNKALEFRNSPGSKTTAQTATIIDFLNLEHPPIAVENNIVTSVADPDP
jgi:hypothetical protein